MTWRTHAAVGANAIWLSTLKGGPDESILLLLPVAIISSLLSDLDATAAKIHFIGGGAFGFFRSSGRGGKFFHHRGIMHSLTASLIYFGILTFLFSSYPTLPIVAATAYASHPLVDGLNGGVGYFYPLIRKQYSLVPKTSRARVGGLVDFFLMFIALLGLLLFFFVFRNQFLPASFGWEPHVY